MSASRPSYSCDVGTTPILDLMSRARLTPIGEVLKVTIQRWVRVSRPLYELYYYLGCTKWTTHKHRECIKAICANLDERSRAPHSSPYLGKPHAKLFCRFDIDI